MWQSLFIAISMTFSLASASGVHPKLFDFATERSRTARDALTTFYRSRSGLLLTPEQRHFIREVSADSRLKRDQRFEAAHAVFLRAHVQDTLQPESLVKIPVELVRAPALRGAADFQFSKIRLETPTDQLSPFIFGAFEIHEREHLAALSYLRALGLWRVQEVTPGNYQELELTFDPRFRHLLEKGAISAEWEWWDALSPDLRDQLNKESLRLLQKPLMGLERVDDGLEEYLKHQLRIRLYQIKHLEFDTVKRILKWHDRGWPLPQRAQEYLDVCEEFLGGL